jgi:hypothetical protein
VAEIPFVGTRFQYRRRGMCRVLMNMLEKVAYSCFFFFFWGGGGGGVWGCKGFIINVTRKQ